MREFLKIALNLFVISLVSAGLLGLVYTHTETARVRNERERLEGFMGRYVDATSGPVRYARIHRFLVEGGTPGTGYVFPVRDGSALLLLSARGDVLFKAKLAKEAGEEVEAEAAVRRALPGAQVRYADSSIMALDGQGRRQASFIQGRTGGFKTWVHVLVALGPDNAVKGLEILTHEEDPGLGAEIEQEYFRNQFAGRTLEELGRLNVVKLPLPDDYRDFLERSMWRERGLTPEKAQDIAARYESEDIHAITGATISSRRVTDGVKRLVQAFVKRIAVVESAARAAGLDPAF